MTTPYDEIVSYQDCEVYTVKVSKASRGDFAAGIVYEYLDWGKDLLNEDEVIARIEVLTEQRYERVCVGACYDFEDFDYHRHLVEKCEERKYKGKYPVWVIDLEAVKLNHELDRWWLPALPSMAKV